MPAHLVTISIDSITHSWHLSRPRAKLILADYIIEFQPLVRKCCFVLKAILKGHLSQPKFITSYNLKTILLYPMDHVHPGYWTEEIFSNFSYSCYMRTQYRPRCSCISELFSTKCEPTVTIHQRGPCMSLTEMLSSAYKTRQLLRVNPKF